jgi:uracil phosphoribosyltransferase
MVNAFLTLLPSDTAVHHLGLFRDKHTLAPVEYYNKLPALDVPAQVDVAFVVDPIIATGGTAATVVAILKEWGVRKIVFTSILASLQGLERAANEWPEGYSQRANATYSSRTVFYVGAIDTKLNDGGYILPG